MEITEKLINYVNYLKSNDFEDSLDWHSEVFAALKIPILERLYYGDSWRSWDPAAKS